MSAESISKPRKIHISLSDEVHRKLRIMAAFEDSTIQDIVFKLIENATKNYPTGKARRQQHDPQ